MKDQHISILVLKDCISMPEAIISAMFSSIAELHIYAVDSDNTGGNHCKLLSMSQLDTFAL